MIKKEVISLEAQCYGGGYKFILLENNIGLFTFEYGSHNAIELDESNIKFIIKSKYLFSRC